jgi:ABC-type nitrate/sulfonate/bicarbonate transport system substrate-binding protein
MNLWMKLRRMGIRCLMAGTLVLTVLDGSARSATPVKIGFYPGIMIMAPIFVAEAMGYYKESGIEPELISIASGPAFSSALASGALDVGFMSPSILAFATQQGLPLEYFAGVGTMPWVLIARDSVPLPNKGNYPAVIHDLKGLNWGIYARGSDSEMFMRLMAADAGLVPNEDVTLVGVGGPATGLPALKVNEIQVYLAPAPAPEVALAGGYAHTVLDMRKGEGPADFKGVVFMGAAATAKWLQAHPKEASGVIRAHEKAYCFIRNPNNFDRLVQILEENMPVGALTPEQFRQMVRNNIQTFTITFPEADFAVWNQALLKSGMVKEPLSTQKILWKGLPPKNPECTG